MKRRIQYNGTSYAVKSDSVEVPDLASLSRFDALIWLNQHTYRQGRGIRTKPNPLAGLGDAITISTNPAATEEIDYQS